MSNPPSVKRTNEQYNTENTSVRLHNLVEAWLLDEEKHLIAFFNLRLGKVSLFSFWNIEETHAANLIMHHLYHAISSDRAKERSDYELINQAISESPLSLRRPQ